MDLLERLHQTVQEELDLVFFEGDAGRLQSRNVTLYVPVVGVLTDHCDGVFVLQCLQDAHEVGMATTVEGHRLLRQIAYFVDLDSHESVNWRCCEVHRFVVVLRLEFDFAQACPSLALFLEDLFPFLQ